MEKVFSRELDLEQRLMDYYQNYDYELREKIAKRVIKEKEVVRNLKEAYEESDCEEFKADLAELIERQEREIEKLQWIVKTREILPKFEDYRACKELIFKPSEVIREEIKKSGWSGLFWLLALLASEEQKPDVEQEMQKLASKAEKENW